MKHRSMSCKTVLRKRFFSRIEVPNRLYARLWNEQSQVYQLDFGGRVTLESAKNFQIEFKGKQVNQSLPSHIESPFTLSPFRSFNLVELKIIATH